MSPMLDSSSISTLFTPLNAKNQNRHEVKEKQNLQLPDASCKFLTPEMMALHCLVVESKQVSE